AAIIHSGKRGNGMTLSRCWLMCFHSAVEMYVQVVRSCGRVLCNKVGHRTIAAAHNVEVYDCWSTSVSSRLCSVYEQEMRRDFDDEVWLPRGDQSRKMISDAVVCKTTVRKHTF
ncbi:unnamed protein product, partial [Ectocarpus sp. 4 AP-2014]